MFRQYICAWCNKVFSDFHKNRKYCSLKCSGASQFKGGWILNTGYRARNIKGKTVLEHRYLMEQHLGRKLRQDEYVDHINGIKSDNKLSNLRLCTKQENEHFYYKILESDYNLVRKRLLDGYTYRDAVMNTTIKSWTTAYNLAKREGIK
jgi:hypothetical protein